MRRTTIFFFAILIIFSCTSCSSKDIQTADLNFAFHCKADIISEGEKMKCDFNYTAPGIASIQLLSSDLSGLNYYWSGGDFTVSYVGLSAKSEKCVLPEKSFAVILLQTLDYAQQEGALTKQKGSKFSGSLNGAGFTITADSGTGQIQTISIPGKGIQAELYEYTKQGL
jgi:hypothetical protein